MWHHVNMIYGTYILLIRYIMLQLFNMSVSILLWNGLCHRFLRYLQLGDSLHENLLSSI